MHQYWGFGLNIESEIEFPELLSSTFDAPDLTIRLGKAPVELTGEDVVKKVRVSASPAEYLIDINNVARYYAYNGRNIIIDPYHEADNESIRLFMLSNAMAAILHQRNTIPFHSSGIVTEKGLILFTGKSGAGKSTTVFGLAQQGFELFTDDVCVLYENHSTGKIEAVPSYPMIKLWENTIDEMATGKFEKSYRVRPSLPKYGIFQHETFINSSIPIHRIFILNANNTAKEFSCTPLDRIKAFNELQINTYRRAQIDMMKMHKLHFQIVTTLTRQARVFQVERPENQEGISAFIQFIKEKLAD